MKRILLTNLLLSSCIIIYAQKTISGTILDGDSGEGLPGVTVQIKGTTSGTSTDLDGFFTLQASAEDVLVISYVGYVAQEITVGNRTTIDVTLASDSELLEEVVVVGYGTQDKKEITSATVSIDEESFNRGPINDPRQLLQGKVAGLTVVNRGGDPNSNATIRVRGISTIGANTQPLVVIDGVIGSSLDNVDPNDIENISVLKDGSAAAIYGSRGSNGVILVTTKSGKGVKSGSRIDYNGQFSVSTIQRQIEVLSAEDFREFGNDLGSSTDWYDEVTREAFTQIHNVSLSGNSGKSNYRFSVNFRDVNGILENSGFDQINTRANYSTRAIQDKLKLSVNLALTNRESNFSFNEALRYATVYNPTAPVFGINANVGNAADYVQFGDYFEAALFDNFNPRSIIDQNTNIGEKKTLNYDVSAVYSFTDNISATATFAQQNISEYNGEYYRKTARFRGFDRNGLARRFAKDDNFTLFEGFGTYANTFDDLNLSVTAGYSWQESSFSEFLIEAGDFAADEEGLNFIENSRDQLSATPQRVTIESAGSPDERIIAFFGRANLVFQDRIYLNASVRREGSSRFGPGNEYGTFPSVGIGVDIDKFVDLPLNTLKLRGGYGVTGSLPSEANLFLTAREFNDDLTTTNILRVGNPDLKWEEKAEINVGVDFSSDRFNGSIDAYTRNVKDFILPVTVDAATAGFDGTQFQNVGEVQTQGIEVNLNYDVVKNTDLDYSTGVVFSSYKTTLEEFIIEEETRANLGAPGQNDTELIRVAIGEEIGQIWGPVFTGQVDDRGQPIFADLNGDGLVLSNQDAALNPNGDFQQLGKGIPDFELGWTHQVSYKNWDLNAFFRGAFGHSLVNTFRAFYEPRIPGQAGYNSLDTELSIADLTTARYGSYYVEKADFVKLDNVTLAYNFDMSSSDIFSNIRLSFNVLNAFTITDYTGVDPEPSLTDVGTTDNGGRAEFVINPDVLSPGIDRRNNYFTARTFTLGLNVTFK